MILTACVLFLLCWRRFRFNFFLFTAFFRWTAITRQMVTWQWEISQNYGEVIRVKKKIMNTAPEAVPAAPRILVSFWVPRAKGDYFVAVNVSLKLHSKREQSKTHLFPLRLQFCRSLESDLQAQAPEQRLVMEPVPFKEVSFRGHARATPRLVSFQGFYMGVPPPRKSASSY